MKTVCCVTILLLVAPTLHAQQYGDMPLSLILIPGEGWKKVDGKFEGIREIAVARPDKGVMDVGVWDVNDKLIALIDESGKLAPIDKHVINDHKRPFAVSLGNGVGYTIDPDKRSLRIGVSKSVKDSEMELPVNEMSVVAVTPNKGTLLIGGAGSKFIWWYRIGELGALSAGEKYSTLRLRKEEARSETCGIDFDTWGRVYVAMKDGVQVFDPTGRFCGLITSPAKQKPTSFCFGGENGGTLYLACGDEIWTKKLNATWHGFKPSEKK